MIEQMSNNGSLHKKAEVIATLTREHKDFSELLRSALKNGVATEAGKAKFRQAKHVIMNHHEKELQFVYKPLQRQMESDEKVRQFLNQQPNNDQICLGFVQTIEMMAKLEESVNKNDKHAETRLKEFIRAISERVDFEEGVLFFLEN